MACDHTHKFANVIDIRGWGGQSFTASYTKHAKNEIKKEYKRRYMQQKRRAQREAREVEKNKRQC